MPMDKFEQDTDDLKIMHELRHHLVSNRLVHR